eukprot:1315889-Pleurochrysis_carterae.AAC.1
MDMVGEAESVSGGGADLSVGGVVAVTGVMRLFAPMWMDGGSRCAGASCTTEANTRANRKLRSG